MDCKKAQRLYHELADGRVAEPMATALRRHLDECSDCRVFQQRAARLQQLLTLKRHEQPPPAYFENFLGEFHRRLALETMRPVWWERLFSMITLDLPSTWRYGLAGACSLLLVLGFVWKASDHLHGGASQPPVAAVTANPPVATVAHVSTVSVDPKQAVAPSAWRTETSGPQYVLERIAVTPASYETASVRF